jgi:hypothetical protein
MPGEHKPQASPTPPPSRYRGRFNILIKPR